MTPDSPHRRLLVIAPNWLGDAVMALPAIADVRRALPSTRVIVAARASVAPLFAMVPGVDEVLTLRWRGQPLQRAALREDVARLRGTADAALLLPNSFSSAWLVARAGVPERWGYATDWRARWLTRAVRLPRHRGHQGGYYQHLVAGLGFANGPCEPEMNVPPANREEIRHTLRASGWDGMRPLVTVAPGAAYGTAKRWLPAHFARVAAELSVARGAQCVFVGSAADREAIALIESSGLLRGCLHPPIDLVGRTTLAQLAAVIAESAACLSNDSGAMHLSGAIGTPVTAVFGPTRERETAPLTRRGNVADVLIHPVWCRPCMLRECPIDHRCMRGLRPERVVGSVAAFVDGARP